MNNKDVLIGIDAGQRNIGRQTINQQCAQSEPNALLEHRGFGKGRPA